LHGGTGGQSLGGSTIAQQLAKQLYGHGIGLGATPRQIGLGVKLSLRYSKARILEMYLNAVSSAGSSHAGSSAAKAAGPLLIYRVALTGTAETSPGAPNGTGVSVQIHPVSSLLGLSC
jgi:hypothetical protein